MWWERGGRGDGTVIYGQQQPEAKETGKSNCFPGNRMWWFEKEWSYIWIFVWITWTPDGEIILEGLVASGVSFKILKAHTIPCLHSFSLSIYLMLINQNASSQWLPQCHACLLACFHAPHHDGHGLEPSGTMSLKLNAFFSRGILLKQLKSNWYTCEIIVLLNFIWEKLILAFHSLERQENINTYCLKLLILDSFLQQSLYPNAGEKKNLTCGNTGD